MERTHSTISFSEHFSDLMRAVSSSGVDTRKEIVICRFLEALQNTSLTKQEHNWWCSVLECMGFSLDSHEWPTVQDFLFALLRSLNRKEMFVGDDFSRIARRYFERDLQSSTMDEPLSCRLGSAERRHAKAVSATIYFCRQYYLTGRCQLGSDCVLEHSCHVCLKKTGRRFCHTMHECNSR